MPEEGNNNPSSGMGPGEKKLKPTVIGGGRKMTPTVIGGGMPEAKKPTVIGEGIRAQADAIGETAPTPPTTIKPTAIPNGIGKKPEAANAEQPAAKPVTKPSLMPGTTRKSLEMTDEQLLTLFPGTSDSVIAQAVKLLIAVVVDMLDEGHCLEWGMKQQKKYGQLIEESLKLSSHKLIQDSSRHLMRLHVILDEVAGTFEDKGGLFRKKKDPWDKYQEVLPELRQLSDLMNQKISEIVAIRGKLYAISEEFAALAVELDATTISAKYLSDALVGNTHKQRESQILLERSLSLTYTTAQIQQGVITRQTTIDEIGKLVSRIQDGVLVKLPAWMEQVGIYQTKSTLTDTDVYSCRQSLDEILTNFK